MAASPASGFWHVCKHPGTIYRKLSFGSLLPFMVTEGPLLASFRFFCQVFYLLQVLLRVSSDKKHVYDVSLPPPLPPQPAGALAV